MALCPRKRIPAIDTAKGLGILCVFLGHLCVVDSAPFRMIFNFHMPLFFVLAGIVFDLDRLGDFRTLMRKLGRNILRPFAFFVLLGVLINIIRGTFLPQPGTNNAFLWILEITKGQPTFVPSAWFLTSMFMTQLTFWLIFAGRTKTQKIKSMVILGAAVFIFGSIVVPIYFKLQTFHPEIRDYLSILLPLKIPTLPFALFFFAIGYFFRERLLRIPYLLPLLFPLTLYASSLFQTPNIAIPIVPVWWCFFPCAIIGALSILSISQRFSFRPLTFIGKNSLIFFMLEGHIVPVILLATHKIFPNSSLSPMTTQLSPILIPLVLFASLACISCLVPTINRLFLRRKSPSLANQPGVTFVQGDIRESAE